jgi:serine/threonine protein kinase
VTERPLPWQLGRYRLLDHLGTGAFGTVFRAEVQGPLGFSEQLAVKLVHPSLAEEQPEALLALADEARLLTHLRHPNIVQIRSFERVGDEYGEYVVLALEYVRGSTLDGVLGVLGHMGRVLPLPAILSFLDDTLAGLGHAHEARGPDGQPLGLVHRDLKPPNLMIDEGGAIRILDFGIAMAKERLVRTMVGTVKGTPPWMSPEQVRGDPLDGRSDLWVLGTIAFRMLAGAPWVRPPHTLAEQTDAMRGLLETTWKDRSQLLHAQLSKGGRFAMRWSERRRLEALLEGWLEVEPDRRPADAEAIRAELRGLPGWDPSKGRGILGTICRGVLQGGRPPGDELVDTRAVPGQSGPSPAQTREMEQDQVVTAPGQEVPR